MRHALSGMASCALALALTVSSADANTGDVKFRATRALTVDSATGKLRRPTAVEVEKMVTDLKRLTARKASTETSRCGSRGRLHRRAGWP